MRVAIDTNVVLDVLLARQPFASDSASLLASVEEGHAVGILGATTITTIHYLAAKTLGRQAGLEAIRRLLGICEIAPVNRAVLTAAAESRMADFEDAVFYAAAMSLQADVIVSRNPKDFRDSVLPVLSPAEANRRIGAGRKE